MATLRIVLKAEHVEDDRRHLDSELAKFRAVLLRAGYETKCEVDFEPHADLKKEARSLQQARVRRHNLGPVSSLEPPDADAAPAKAPAKKRSRAKAKK